MSEFDPRAGDYPLPADPLPPDPGEAVLTMIENLMVMVQVLERRVSRLEEARRE